MPTDTNQRSLAVVEIATGTREAPDEDEDREKARADASKGGTARADTLTPERRSEIARKAAAARWHHADGGTTGT